jgi:hypothetical protein
MTQRHHVVNGERCQPGASDTGRNLSLSPMPLPPFSDNNGRSDRAKHQERPIGEEHRQDADSHRQHGCRSVPAPLACDEQTKDDCNSGCGLNAVLLDLVREVDQVWRQRHQNGRQDRHPPVKDPTAHSPCERDDGDPGEEGKQAQGVLA